MTKTSHHSGTRTNRAVRLLKELVRRAGERATWMERDAETLARRVELPRFAWPGGYEMLYVGHDGEYPLCQGCAQHDLEEAGDWPDGYDYVAGGPADYGGRTEILCNGCGDPIASFNDE